MRWPELLQSVDSLPVFSTGMLLTSGRSKDDVELQLSRWARSGNLIQLRRGLYALGETYRKTEPHPFLIANSLVSPSYVSLQSALDFYNLIPEATRRVTSITTRRPGVKRTDLGTYSFKHVKAEFFFGYQRINLGGSQHAFVARPEKALLDLVYLTPGADDEHWIEEMRFQNLHQIDEEALGDMVERWASPKISHAARLIVKVKNAEEYERL
jgi:predicted transcriptional regulator of viral defense system